MERGLPAPRPPAQPDVLAHQGDVGARPRAGGLRRASRHVVLAKDYVVFRLTGRLATDPSDASATNAFDQTRGRVVGRAARRPRSSTPAVPGDRRVDPRWSAAVTAAAAEETGLAAGTPVVVGGGDGPWRRRRRRHPAEAGAYVYLGSSSWVSMAATEPLHDPAMRTMTFDHVLPGHFVPTATMQAGGASLDWITDVLERAARPASTRRRRRADGGLRRAVLPALPAGRALAVLEPRRARRVRRAPRHHGRPSSPARCSRASPSTCSPASRRSAETGAASTRGRDRRRRGERRVAAGAGRRVGLRGPPALAGGRGNSLGAAVTAGVGVGLFDGFDVAPGPLAGRRRVHARRGAARGYAERHALFLRGLRAGSTVVQPRSGRWALVSPAAAGTLGLVSRSFARPTPPRQLAPPAERRARPTPRHEPEALAAARTRSAGSPAPAPVTAAHPRAAPRLRVLARYGVGFDAVDLAAAPTRVVSPARRARTARRSPTTPWR